MNKKNILTKKITSVVIAIVVAVCLIFPVNTNAQNAAELRAQIEALLQQLSQLQAQLATLEGTQQPESRVPSACIGITFNRNLTVGSSGNDMKCLQALLNSDPVTVLASSGPGSPGNETTYFGPLTKAAVIKFQNKYSPEILAPLKLTAGTGFVGTFTRAKLNQILASLQTTPTTPTTPTPPTTQPVTGNALKVEVAPDTPAGGDIANNATTNFTKFILTAGDSDVSLNSIVVTRFGLSSNSDVENIRIVDEKGVQVGSVANLNNNSKAVITFIPALVVPAKTSKAFSIRAGIASDTTSGRTVILGIDSSEEVSAGNITILGDFPVKGKTFSVINLQIASVQISSDGTVIDAKPDVGDTDVILNQFKITVDSVEPVIIEQITVQKAGSSRLNDTRNIKLFDVSKNVILGTTDWDLNGKASWTNLDLLINKGETRRFKVTADIANGSSLTVNADLTEGSNVLMSIKGKTYGFYITPTVIGNWNGKGANDQTIQSGSLTIRKGAKTPAVGNIAQAADQKLTSFDFTVAGEPIRITSFKISFDLETMTVSHVTNVKLLDDNGSLIAGPKNVTAGPYAPNTISYEGIATFTDVILLPVGTSSCMVIADIGSGTPDGSKITVGIADPDTDIIALGTRTGDSIIAEPANREVNGNQQTVSAGSLTATTLTQPPSSSVAKGAQKFLWAIASLSAINSGEDVIVNSITIQEIVGNSANTDSITNVEIWADLNAENSERGDVFETKIVSSPKSFPSNTASATLTFPISKGLVVERGKFVNIAVIGDLSSNAVFDGTHRVNVSAISATGISTGTTLSTIIAGSGQTMTVKTGGTITVSIDPTSPSAKLVLAGASRETIAVFRLSANNIENMDLNSIKVRAIGQTTDTITHYYFYSSSRSDGKSTLDPITTAPGGETASVYLPDGTVTIPANNHVKISVKVDIPNVDGTQIQNGDSIQLAIVSPGDIKATGKSSGQLITSNQTNLKSEVHTIYESYPRFTVSQNSPSGPLIPSVNRLLAVFDITAEGLKDVTFDSGNGNKIVFQITVVGDDTNSASETITFKDKNGNTLGTGTITSATETTQLTLDFANRSLIIPGGKTSQIYVYGDTTDLEDKGDIIQIWLQDSATDIDFGIDGKDFDNAEGDKIFRGNIFAPALVRP